MSTTPANKRYLVISIGNTDNHLTQQQWSEFVKETEDIIKTYCSQIHCFGGPANWAPWQNVSWIAEVTDMTALNTAPLRDQLVKIRKKFKQKSIMLIYATPKFI